MVLVGAAALTRINCVETAAATATAVIGTSDMTRWRLQCNPIREAPWLDSPVAGMLMACRSEASLPPSAAVAGFRGRGLLPHTARGGELAKVPKDWPCYPTSATMGPS